MIFFIGITTGLLIGMVGIGGILLSPLLSYVLHMDLHLAMATSSWSFLFTGVIGTFFYAKKKSISWEKVWWLSLGIVPATLIGARTNVFLPAKFLTIILAILIGFSGLHAFIRQSVKNLKPNQIGNFQLILIGFAVGFGSALTGTGGPVLLVPIFLFLQFPALQSVGVSQAIQLPIAIFAAMGFALYGQIDFLMGTQLGLIQSAGVVFGALLAHRIAPERLRQIVAFALIGVGILMIGRTIFD
ncbi:MAG: sulfite exporter TauE/SafE family protein [SAR324 cluster bacterium]|nr:sulfite exporter TauE/SafE family protein [SAR324 cluster bacterium]